MILSYPASRDIVHRSVPLAEKKIQVTTLHASQRETYASEQCGYSRNLRLVNMLLLNNERLL